MFICNISTATQTLFGGTLTTHWPLIKMWSCIVVNPTAPGEMGPSTVMMSLIAVFLSKQAHQVLATRGTY